MHLEMVSGWTYTSFIDVLLSQPVLHMYHIHLHFGKHIGLLYKYFSSALVLVS